MRKWVSMLLVCGLMALWIVPSASASPNLPMTVVFKSATLPANAAAIVSKAGGTVLASIPEIGVMQISGPAHLLSGLGRHSAIASISPTLEITLAPAQVVAATDLAAAPNTAAADLYNAYQWDIKEMTHDGASWNLATGSHNTVVGIIDTGVSQNHPALTGNLLGGRNFTPDGPGGSVDPSDIEDRHGHGSHVAGAIAGDGRILGIGPDLGFRAYRVFSATGGSPSTRIMAAMIAAVHDGVDVISMSLGGFNVNNYTWTDPATGTVYRGSDVADTVAYRRAVHYAVQSGVTVVAAAGNEAINIAHPPTMTAFLNQEYGIYGYAFWGASFETPGTLSGVLTVSATGPDKSLASYSNYGPGAIDLAAPGGDFQRYPEPGWHLDMSLSAYMGSGYAWMAGTSMATPKVSAVAALLIDRAKANGRTLTPSQVVAHLQQTAVDQGKVGTDPFYGHGMVDAYLALGGN